MIDTSVLGLSLVPWKRRLICASEVIFEWRHVLNTYFSFCFIPGKYCTVIRTLLSGRRYQDINPDAVIRTKRSRRTSILAGRQFSQDVNSRRTSIPFGRRFPARTKFSFCSSSGTLTPKRSYHLFCDVLKHVQEFHNCTDVLLFSLNVFKHVVGTSLKHAV